MTNFHLISLEIITYMLFKTFLLTTIKSKNIVLIDLQTNPPKCPQCGTNDVEGIEYCQLHHV